MKSLFKWKPSASDWLGIGLAMIPLLLSGDNKEKRKKKALATLNKDKYKTERERRLGLVPGDEGLVAKIRDRWTELAEKAHEIYPSIPVQRILEFIHIESGGRPTLTSSAGAEGLMQLMPSAQQQYSVADPFDPWDNIEGGVHLLSDLHARFNGDYDFMASGYNAGPNHEWHKKAWKTKNKNLLQNKEYIKRLRALHQLYNEVA
jgi:soluble lytic murein transglycosylase-like protein